MYSQISVKFYSILARSCGVVVVVLVERFWFCGALGLVEF